MWRLDRRPAPVPVTPRSLRAIISGVAAVVVWASCSDTTAPVSAVVLRASADSLFFGDSLQLDAVALGDSAAVAAPTFVWTSSDTSIAIVDSAGMVLGVSTGSATITAEFRGRRAEFAVRVVLYRADGGVSFGSMARGSRIPLCALASDGSPYCEGSADDGLTLFTPLPNRGDLVFTSFHVSNHSRCGLTTASLMYCWGRNGHGHFGTGMPVTFQSDDAPVLGAGGRTFKALAVGGHSQTCGVNAEDDVAYCFGHNDFGQVGRGPRAAEDTVVAPIEGAPKAIAVATTEFDSCLITLDGAPMCWGGGSTTPTAAASPEPLTSVSIGGAQKCAFGASRTLYCWGLNAHGETGVGISDNSIAAPTEVVIGVEFADVFPGAFATCAVTGDGALYCWGDFQPRSVSSRLGDARYAPVRLLPELSFKSVAIHVGRTCGVTIDGRLYCWK